MPLVKISSRAPAVSLNDEDQFLVAIAGTTKKISALDLKRILSKLPSQLCVCYVGGNGVGFTPSDSNDGLSPWSPKATIQSAYNGFPDWVGSNQGGGTIFLLPGLHDIGTGFVGNSLNKCCTITSISGDKPMLPAAARGSSLPLFYPTIMTTQHATALFKLGAVGSNANQDGWVIRGLGFDCTDPATINAIDAPDTNHNHIYNNSFQANDISEKYALVSRVDDGSDCSWWRVHDNWCDGMGLGRFGDGNNCNQMVVRDNAIFPGDHSCGMIFTTPTRCSTRDNNIEGSGPAAIKVVEGQACSFDGDGGEGTWDQAFLWVDSSTSDCWMNPIGSLADFPVGANVKIKDENTAGAPNRYPKATHQAFGYTTNHTLTFADATQASCVRMNSGSALNLTVPPDFCPRGSEILINQRDVGVVTFVQGAGVVINSFGDKLRTAGIKAQASLHNVGNNEWMLRGDLQV